MCVLSVLAWGGEDPVEEKRGDSVQQHLLSGERQGHRGAEMRRVVGAEGAASQGRCSLLFSTVSWGGDYSSSQNSKRASCPLTFPSLPCDQIPIPTSQLINHLKTCKKYSCYETLVSTGRPQLSPCHPLASS